MDPHRPPFPSNEISTRNPSKRSKGGKAQRIPPSPELDGRSRPSRGASDGHHTIFQAAQQTRFPPSMREPFHALCNGD